MNAPTFKDNQLPQGGIAHVVGSKDPELWRRTIPNIFKDTVYRFADREAAVFPEQEIRWTWAELNCEVDALAHGLLELGLQKGDRVGIWSPNRYEWLLTQFATARIGIILVTINPAYRVSEVEFVLNKVGCTALITASHFKTSDYIRMLQDLAPELSHCEPGALTAAKLPNLKKVERLVGLFLLILINHLYVIDVYLHHRTLRVHQRL